MNDFIAMSDMLSQSITDETMDFKLNFNGMTTYN